MAPPIVLFVAARKGNQQKQKSTLKACDPVVTLRQLAASILGPDAEVGRVEAVATLGGETTGTNSTVDDLGYTAHFLQKYFDASFVASSRRSTLGSQIIVDLARGDLVLNHALTIIAEGRFGI